MNFFEENRLLFIMNLDGKDVRPEEGNPKRTTHCHLPPLPSKARWIKNCCSTYQGGSHNDCKHKEHYSTKRCHARIPEAHLELRWLSSTLPISQKDIFPQDEDEVQSQ